MKDFEQSISQKSFTLGHFYNIYENGVCFSSYLTLYKTYFGYVTI